MPTTPDFEHFCRDVIGEPISAAWVVFYRVVEGLPLNAEQSQLYCASTGRTEYVPRPGGYQEATGICGRRARRHKRASSFSVEDRLRRLRKAVADVVVRAIGQAHQVAQNSADLAGHARRERRTSHRRVVGAGSPLLSQEIAESHRSEFVFKNGLALTTFPATKASVRSLACPCALLDELAFVSIEGADDKELVRQLRPSMIEFGSTSRLIKLSTPWQRSGILYEEYSQRLERSDLLVWQASTQVMTPRISVADLEESEFRPELFHA